MSGTNRSFFGVATASMALMSIDGGHLSALPRAGLRRGPRTEEQIRVERQPICIGSRVRSAGALGDVLYYRAVAKDGGHLEVGYFAFFSEERPWGNNWMTWTLLPSLAIDLVYSRTLFVAPGLQRVLYGAGDVEGVGVAYETLADGSLLLLRARADDGSHRPVSLSRSDALAVDPSRPTFYSDVWSHQLGARGARSRRDLAYERCYAEGSIRPLPDSIAHAFRIDDDGRAPPAHVERLAGRRIDDAGPNERAPLANAER